MTKTYNKKIERAITKFAKKHHLQYEDVQALVEWVEWEAATENTKRTVDLIKGSSRM